MHSFTSSTKQNGISYFIRGWELVRHPAIRHFVILPLLANVVFMSAGFWWLFSTISRWVEVGLTYLPSWLQWLNYLASALIILTIIVLFSYLFSTITNIIASPFNGLLAEQLEAILTNTPPPPGGLSTLLQDLPRVMRRELQKLTYFLLRATPLLLLYFIPVIGQTVAPILWFVFTAWMLNIQYVDYPFDNHKISFIAMRKTLSNNRVVSLQFGSLVNLFTLIPILNLIIMPIAVCGATAMWVDRYRTEYKPSNESDKTIMK